MFNRSYVCSVLAGDLGVFLGLPSCSDRPQTADYKIGTVSLCLMAPLNASEMFA